MPVTVSYPGVYIEELPSGVHTITGVATSITAFVGTAQMGPVNVPTTINSYSDYDNIFGGLWANSMMSFAVNDFFQNGGSQGIVVRVAPDGSETASIVLEPNSISPPSSPLASSFTTLTLQASSPGSWGNNVGVIVDLNTKNPSDPTLFNLTAQLTDPTSGAILATEKWLNLSIDPTSSRYVVTWLQQNSQLVAVAQNSESDYEVPGVQPAATQPTVLSPPTSPPQTQILPQMMSGGSDGVGNLTDMDLIGYPAKKQGLYALDNAALFNLLVIPPYVINSGAFVDVDGTVQAAAATYCVQRRAFYIMDPSTTWTTVALAQTGFLNTTANLGANSDHAALYFPMLVEANLLNDSQLQNFVPSGAMAGMYARIDAQRGVWKAPAGQETALTGVQGLSVLLTDMENGQLNPLGLNCLRSFPVIGRVIWGARTTQGADQLESQWKYVPVRRTALFIEQSLYQGTQWVVFEPNDDALWAAIRLSVGSFMQSLFIQGAFQGTTPQTAYFVKCDSETTTQNDIDQGIVNIVVGFAPLQPAEFVIIQIQQMAGQLQV
ncbi:MAG TPA: phage tail sheath C-terminal domain-containing protein [Acidobacteriaceae bacterium]|nr:phage tail sheath C-terminal domain-containing protein [Acidobacteriaceae bacterium]